MKFNTIKEAIEDIKAGRMVVVVDDEDRENEGDMIMAAGKVTPEDINFMAKYGRGLICVPMTSERLAALEIPRMVTNNTEKFGTDFCVSVEAKHKVTTGISAYDRAATIRTLVDPDTKPSDLAMPGHMFPLRAKNGGVLRRVGHTEAAVDLARLAELAPAGVICEILNEDGSMARLPQLLEFARNHGLKIISIEDLVKYRRRFEKLVERVATTKIPTDHAEFSVHAYTSSVDTHQHLALVAGEIDPDKPVLVRVHSECLTGDVFGSLRCDCGEQLHIAMKMVAKRGVGVVLYMRQEGRGIGLANKIRAYELQDNGHDTVSANESLGLRADLRDYGIGAQILADLGVQKMELLTNNPKKIVGLEAYGLKIIKRISIEIPPNHINLRYLQTKRDKLGHKILQVTNNEQVSILNSATRKDTQKGFSFKGGR